MVPSPIDTVIANDATLSRLQRSLGIRDRTSVEDSQRVPISLCGTNDNGIVERRILELFKMPNCANEEEPSRYPFEKDVNFLAFDIKVSRDYANKLTKCLYTATLDTRDLKETPMGLGAKNFIKNIKWGEVIREPTYAVPPHHGKEVFKREVIQLLRQSNHDKCMSLPFWNSARNIVVVCYDLPELQKHLDEVGIDLNQQPNVIDVIDIATLADASHSRACWANLISRGEDNFEHTTIPCATKLSLENIAWVARNLHERSATPVRNSPSPSWESHVTLQVFVQIACAHLPIGIDGGDLNKPNRLAIYEGSRIGRWTPRHLFTQAANAAIRVGQKCRDYFCVSPSRRSEGLETSGSRDSLNGPEKTETIVGDEESSSSLSSSASSAKLGGHCRPERQGNDVLPPKASVILGEQDEDKNSISHNASHEEREGWRIVNGMWQVILLAPNKPAHRKVNLPDDVHAYLTMYKSTSELFDRYLYEEARRFNCLGGCAREVVKIFGSGDSDSDERTYRREKLSYSINNYVQLATNVRQHCPQGADRRMMIALRSQIFGREIVDGWYDDNFPPGHPKRLVASRHRGFTALMKKVQDILEGSN